MRGTAERVERLAEGQHDVERIVAPRTDHLDQLAVLQQRRTGRARERLLVRELGRRRDQLAERLEVAELQIRRLTEIGVDVGGELFEIDPAHITEVAARAHAQRARRFAIALPGPGHHGYSLDQRVAGRRASAPRASRRPREALR